MQSIVWMKGSVWLECGGRKVAWAHLHVPLPLRVWPSRIWKYLITIALLLSTSHVPGIYPLSSVMFKSILRGRYCYPHFTYRETEAQRDSGTCQGLALGQSWVCLTLKSMLNTPTHAQDEREPCSWSRYHTKPLHTLLGDPETHVLSRKPGARDLWFGRKRAVETQGSQGPCVSWPGDRNSGSGPARERTAKSSQGVESTPPSLSHTTLKYAPFSAPSLLSPTEVEAALVMAGTPGP